MKLLKNIPNKLFKSKKSRSISRSEDPSFGSGTASSCSDYESYRGFKKLNGQATPTSVLPPNDISADEWSEILQAFHMIDNDGDGKTRKEQLEAILTRVGPDPPSEEELISLLNEVDRNGDGCISLEEFGAISSAFGPPACDDELRNAFDFFDANHDGKITAEEFFNVFRTIGDGRCTLEVCRRMIRGVDKYGDGFVCFEDSCLMMEQQRRLIENIYLDLQ